MDAIDVRQLHKSFESVAVLRGLDLRVPVGGVYGLLGQNGSGKSTLIHTLLGFLRPQAGTVRIFGSTDLERVRGQIGYLPERLRYHLRYTGREYLRYLGQFHDMPRAQLEARLSEELRAVGLSSAADRLLSTYSKGMLQRIGIAQALLAEPELLLIDEPTSGLDPSGQHEMLGMLASLRDRGLTIFLTTHYLEEAEQLCDRVGILYAGRIAREVEMATLRTPSRNVRIRPALLPLELAAQLERLDPAVQCVSGQVLIQPNTAELQARVLRMLLDADIAILALEQQGRPLEELYMRVVRGAEPEPAPASTVAEAVEPPPNGLFAPPGHPDALRPVERASESPTMPATEAPRMGDTLLRELLRRDDTSSEAP